MKTVRTVSSRLRSNPEKEFLHEHQRTGSFLEARYSGCLSGAESERNTLLTKILAFLTVAYALSPIDLIPDFVPVLGYLDDLIILPALVFLTCKLIPREIFAAYQKQAEGMWQNGKPKKWYYAVPIVLIWALILYWIITKLV